MRKGRIFLFLVLGSFAIASLLFFRQQIASKQPDGTSDLKVVEQLYSLIQEKSVYDTKNEALVEGALRGMASSIKDPYSTYYTKSEAALHKASLAGEKVGIGVEIAEKNGKFIVISPVKSSPAERAGIRPLDEIVQINDVRLDGKTMGDVMQLIQGKEGQEVALVLYRPSLERHIKVSVKREAMKNKTVEASVLKVEDTSIGYITITLFAEDTAEQWVNAMSQLLGQDIKGVIIDVRDNPGGYLHSVAAIISTMEKKQKTFAYMQDGDGAMNALKTENLKGTEKLQEAFSKLPIVVIQNEGSASASEVFSGAIQSWEKGTIIGTKSFGKGTVQESWTLTNGGQLKLSTNKWLTPNKEWIHQKGIQPDVESKQHILYTVELLPLSGHFEVGDFSEEISYTQKILHALGYHIVRQDGYFDEKTADAVSLFRERHDLFEGTHLDELFFEKMQAEVLLYKEKNENDLQLQMGISFIMHEVHS
ncbi:S41 family peptidase [Lysinibacillus sp. 54212]|uniref:S41 family peptidase n=1 Tax=Lysinibacillus sp. 54212 TaxID=3119829 RepID=UPI002FC7D8F5